VLKATLFGIGKASYLEHELPGFPGQQACLLLCYLFLNKQHPHHREQLAAIFWPDHPSDIARKYLRNSLWRMRQVLLSAGAPPDEYLFYAEDSIAFINSSSHWLDVDSFESTASRYHNLPAGQLEQTGAAQLSAAVDLYTGDLLENVYEDWCLYERERLRMLYLNSLHKLMIYHGLQGGYDHGIQFGERILARDNTREKVHRQMMWLHWLSGNRDAALAQYQRCTRILREELNAQPMAETHLLFEQMRAGQVSAPVNAWSDVHTAGLPSQSSLPASRSPASEVEQRLTPLLEQTRRRLLQLQQMIDETRAELHHIERTLEDAAARS
jgi:DNA-binding SARP family transcriptional activator